LNDSYFYKTFGFDKRPLFLFSFHVLIHKKDFQVLLFETYLTYHTKKTFFCDSDEYKKDWKL
jgi:hypothetical protein